MRTTGRSILAVLLAVVAIAYFPESTRAQAAPLRVISSYRTNKLPPPLTSIDSSKVILVVELQGLSHSEWSDLRDFYVLADGSQSNWVDKALYQSMTKDGETVGTNLSEATFIVPRGALKFELKVGSAAPIAFKVEPGVRKE